MEKMISGGSIMKQKKMMSPTETKLNNARLWLLLITVLSAVNLILPYVTGTYFVFSSYFSRLIADIGYFTALELEAPVIMYVFTAVAAVCIVPYLLCWIFSKKHYGWMIAGLVLFCLDTAVFLIDVPAYIVAGDYSVIVDLLFRIFGIVALASGVKTALGVEKEKRENKEKAESGVSDEGDAQNGGVTETDPTATRELTITRKKAFAGCAVAFVCYADDKMICQVKNGESVKVDVPASSFSLGVMLSSQFASAKITVPAGTDPIAYTAYVKTGFWSGKLIITETAEQGAKK